ncbi:S8 family serine peptidase [Lapillicoccus sp.]|uniref:S8 family serine peptidase n=1 Tax=Lapillicoccus sp. TaxID=1909287 RepID=UPI0032659A17
MNRTARCLLAGAGTLTLAGSLGLMPTGASAANGPNTFTAKAISPASSFSSLKSESGQLAKSDQALLARTDAATVNVVVKLDYDASASYRGGLRGLPATSPRVTGKKLTGSSAAEKAYAAYTGSIDSSFRAALAAKVPAAKAGTTLSTVYGGLAVKLPANQAKNLVGLAGVAAVQSDSLQKPDAIEEGPQFIGAPAIWSQTGGQTLSGKGVIFADLDSGIWPEHPMLADNPALGTPPGAPSGQARPCIFGDNPLTPATDVFQCNHKVIGGKPFLDSYNVVYPGKEVYADSARDSDGHGTHTTTTAAGERVAHALDLGVDRGPISGVAPGAWVLEYKVCGAEGCFSSDSAAAVAQAIKDGADVINFSISGGNDPYSDPVELAFLDAYNAGVFVAASAGNSGPGAATTAHRSPWVTTVAASTQLRAFTSTLTVADGGATATFEGTTLTAGVTTPTPIVLAQDIPGYDKLCSTPLTAGAATGKIVACQRGNPVGRVDDGYNVAAGGAAGMILYNPTLADTESDNHFLPAVHLADGTAFLAFLAAHPAATGSWPQGEKSVGTPDVMAAFSSRGPGGQFLKPDITAPGTQVLAGNTPTPDAIPAGPTGQYYQAIAGTSMSSPHIAGSAILVKALRNWLSPGQIKSSLMTTATTAVVKEDEKTPADPFDMGAGRVDLTKAGTAPIVFDESALNMATMGQDPATAVELNLPSINLPTMPGSIVVKRTALNVSGKAYDFTVSTSAGDKSSIKVTPSSGRIRPGESQTFTIQVYSNAPEGQQFGSITLKAAGVPDVHLPVAFNNKQGQVSLTQSCTPSSFAVGATSVCTVTADNQSASDAKVVINSTLTGGTSLTSVTGGQRTSNQSATTGWRTLAAPKDAIPSIAPGTTPGGGFLDLAGFGIAPRAIGDEDIVNYTVPAFLYGGKSYTSLGMDSNGYIVVGGGDSGDTAFTPQTLPDPARPNGVLAPYWTDLDGTGAAGIRLGSLTDGVHSWLVAQWNVHVYGDATATGLRTMQVWIGTGGGEDISYAYDASTVGKDAPTGTGLTVGAENVTGTAGAQISGPPQGSYVITTVPGQPGGSLTMTLTVKGDSAGRAALTSISRSNVTLGTTRVITPLTVTRS